MNIPSREEAIKRKRTFSACIEGNIQDLNEKFDYENLPAKQPLENKGLRTTDFKFPPEFTDMSFLNQTPHKKKNKTEPKFDKIKEEEEKDDDDSD